MDSVFWLVQPGAMKNFQALSKLKIFKKKWFSSRWKSTELNSLLVSGAVMHPKNLPSGPVKAGRGSPAALTFLIICFLQPPSACLWKLEKPPGNDEGQVNNDIWMNVEFTRLLNNKKQENKWWETLNSMFTLPIWTCVCVFECVCFSSKWKQLTALSLCWQLFNYEQDSVDWEVLP